MIFKIKYFFFKILLNILITFRIVENKRSNSFLLYHSIPKKSICFDLDEIELSNFEKQCRFIYYHQSFKFAYTQDNLNAINNLITLTFDDGYKNIISNVLPIIKKYKIPILIFICPELVGKNNYLNIEDLKELSKIKYIEFGIHGYKHIHYGEKSINLFETHLKKSIDWFYSNLDKYKPISFSFPYGSYNKKIINFLKNQNQIQLCFSSNFSTLDNKNIDYYQIPRISIWQLDNIKSFENKIFGKWDIVKYFIKTNER